MPRGIRNTRYRVVNPRGIPAGFPVFKQGDRAWYEGDIYDGNASQEPLRRGFLKQEGQAVEEEDEHGED